MNQSKKMNLTNSVRIEVHEASDCGITIRLPIKIKRRSARILIGLPDAQCESRPWDLNPTSLQLALARGYRWLAMLENGAASSLREIAKKEGIDNSYVSRMINLTTLAPDIIRAILDDTLPAHVTLFQLGSNTPKLWDEQRAIFLDKS